MEFKQVPTQTNTAHQLSSTIQETQHGCIPRSIPGSHVVNTPQSNYPQRMMTTGTANLVVNRHPATHASPTNKHCGASASTSRPVKVTNASNVPASAAQLAGSVRRENAVAKSQSPVTVDLTTSQVKTKRIRSSADENNHLSCSVCFEKFVSPKVLPCGHTFCLQCVEDIVGKGGPQLSPLCPICRVDVKLPESGKPEDLPTNFQVVSMLADNVSEKSQDDTKVKSARCAMHHEEYKLYCQTCAVPVCVECILKEHKIGTHLVIHEEDFIAKQLTLVDKSAKELAPLQKKFKATDERMSSCKKAYAQQVTVVKQEIRKKCSEMLWKLTENANKLLSQVDDYEKKEDATFGKVQEVLEKSRESLEGFDAELTTSRQKVADLGVSSNVDMNLNSGVIATILTGLQELNEVSAPITSKLVLKFRPSETTEAIGSLYILKYT